MGDGIVVPGVAKPCVRMAPGFILIGERPDF